MLQLSTRALAPIHQSPNYSPWSRNIASRCPVPPY